MYWDLRQKFAEDGPISTSHSLFTYLRQYGLYKTRTAIRAKRYQLVNGHNLGNITGCLRVSPAGVHSYLSPRFGPQSAVFRIKGGAWDQNNAHEITDYDMFIAFNEHFTRGVPWQQTDFYQRIVGEINAGKKKWSCRTESEFQDVCRTFDDLYESIEQHGMLPMTELVLKDSFDGQYPAHAHEICIAVGRDGTLYSDEGRHRMFIAKTLGLESIPVRVLVRHTEWQAIRDRVAGLSVPIRDHPTLSQFATHPDLEDLLPVGAEKQNS